MPNTIKINARYELDIFGDRVRVYDLDSREDPNMMEFNFEDLDAIVGAINKERGLS